MTVMTEDGTLYCAVGCRSVRLRPEAFRSGGDALWKLEMNGEVPDFCR